MMYQNFLDFIIKGDHSVALVLEFVFKKEAKYISACIFSHLIRICTLPFCF